MAAKGAPGFVVRLSVNSGSPVKTVKLEETGVVSFAVNELRLWATAVRGAWHGGVVLRSTLSK